ncbi:MAG: cyclic lactone autoinducer peptide [Ruminococcus flavefaciens]|nr:cyclic lactone autoinducer peptide [Ruminococcus flavefaciens]
MKKNIVLKAVAAIGRKSAMKAYSTASAYCSYQPVEPKALKYMKNSKKSK